MVSIWFFMYYFFFTYVAWRKGSKPVNKTIDLGEGGVDCRVVGTIWCVGAGDPSSHPVRNGNSGNPLRLTNPHSLGGSSVK